MKALITSIKDLTAGKLQKKIYVKRPFKFSIVLDKNGQIHDVRPRTFCNTDLFSKYHGRTLEWSTVLVNEMTQLFNESRNVQEI